MVLKHPYGFLSKCLKSGFAERGWFVFYRGQL